MRNRTECRCKPQNIFSKETTYNAFCRWGNCVEWRCVGCDANLGGFGRVGCKCDGYIRYMFHPAMRSLDTSAAVKPSIMRRRNRKPASVDNW